LFGSEKRVGVWCIEVCIKCILWFVCLMVLLVRVWGWCLKCLRRMVKTLFG